MSAFKPYVPVAGMRTQHPFDHLRDHREPKRIGAPARHLDRRMETGFEKQNLRVMPGARAGVFVDSLLHQERRIPVDEVRERGGVPDRVPLPEYVKQSHQILPNSQRTAPDRLPPPPLTLLFPNKFRVENPRYWSKVL